MTTPSGPGKRIPHHGEKPVGRGGRAAAGARSYDGGMSCAVQPSSRRPAGRGFVLLVLAVLAGVLAMHGLGPDPAPMKVATAGSARGAAMTHERAVDAAGDCAHATGGAGHAHHADALCVAAGVGSPYVPPPLASVPDVPRALQVFPSGAAGSPEGGRAPPDLAELQLLGI
ncbi:DUF6153 family protein [[Kitasatospora] papulosa]|uniref:DUF6153 family protein n=3 Tax=Streptomyces TaxID=1883 RepID=UPI00296F1344